MKKDIYSMYSIGRYSVSAIVLEHFGLDGGAMFGSVPKTLWSKALPPDERNRIPLCTRVLLLEGPEGRILIDCGNGEKWSEKERAIYDIQPRSPLPLRELIPNVQHVVLTHLHFDHAGGATYRSSDDELKLSYPEATHYLQRSNLDRALSPGVRERGSYLADTVGPISGAKLQLLEDGVEILPGVSVHRVNGHTQGLQWILIRDEKDTLAYPSDLIPTAHHVHIPWLMGYDLHAEWTMEEKSAFLEQALTEQWLVVLEHDRDTTCGRIQRTTDGRYSLVADSALA